IRHIANREIIGCSGHDLVPLAQELDDLPLCDGRRLLADRRNHSLTYRWYLLAQQFALDRRVGHYSRVILILSNHGLALCRKDAHHTERKVANTDRLADGIDAWKKLVGHRFPKNDHASCGTDIGISK